MLCGCTAEHWSPSPLLLREDWLSVSREWRGSEMRCRPGTAGGPAEGARAAAVVAGKEDPMDTVTATGMDTATGTDTVHLEGPGPRECTSSLWRREPGLWPSITPSPCARTASLSTARCSFSVRITSSENTPKRSPNGHILYLAMCSE